MYTQYTLLYSNKTTENKTKENVQESAEMYLPVDFRSTDITREQFKRSLKSWLFECAYSRRHV